MGSKKINTKYDNKPTTDILKKAGELGLSKEKLVEMYGTMVEIRHFEEMATQLYALGKVHGTMHLSIGQEGVAIGTGTVMQDRDYLINHHRGHGHFIASGADVNKMMAEFLGKATGYCHGHGGSMHIADISANNLGANGIVGGGMQLVTGVGLAIQMKKTDQVALVLFGDGAANEGIFQESLNMCSLWKLPVIFLCENNHYGMSAAVEQVSAKIPFTHRAKSYDIPAYFIDGNDPLAVVEYMQKAVNHTRSGKGPMFLEVETYRWMGHSKSDRNLYRSKEEIDSWKAKDPIKRFKKLLLEADIVTKTDLDEIDNKMAKVIEDAVEFAETSPEPDLKNLTEYVYA